MCSGARMWIGAAMVIAGVRAANPSPPRPLPLTPELRTGSPADQVLQRLHVLKARRRPEERKIDSHLLDRISYDDGPIAVTVRMATEANADDLRARGLAVQHLDRHRSTGSGTRPHVLQKARTSQRSGRPSPADLSGGADRVRLEATDGTGVVVGVISGGIRTAAARRRAGCPPSWCPTTRAVDGNGDEGTALLEIVTIRARHHAAVRDRHRRRRRVREGRRLQETRAPRSSSTPGSSTSRSRGSRRRCAPPSRRVS